MIDDTRGEKSMTRGLNKLAMVILLGGWLLVVGCAEKKEYMSPYMQQQTDPTYRELYPRPFNTQPGPSATSSGDE